MVGHDLPPLADKDNVRRSLVKLAIRNPRFRRRVCSPSSPFVRGRPLTVSGGAKRRLLHAVLERLSGFVMVGPKNCGAGSVRGIRADDASGAPLFRLAKFIAAAQDPGADSIELGDAVGVLVSASTRGLIWFLRPSVVASYGSTATTTSASPSPWTPCAQDSSEEADGMASSGA